MSVVLRPTANSYDLFDTLITRRGFHPRRVFEDVERGLGADGYTAARVAAEQALMQRGAAFDLHDIYREIVARGQCAPDTAEKLKAAEIDAEFDHAVPITENLRRVCERDLVVSDMYLPAGVLRRLLQHVGLRVFVHLFVSNAGKHSGEIWPKISERWLVQRHLGDKLHADVESPRRQGIAAELFAGAEPSQVEQWLARQHGQVELAGIVRALRLRNPHPADTPESRLWLLYAQLNLPLLCLVAAAVRGAQISHGRARALFSARGGYFLSEIFSLLYPAVPADYLYVSRQVLSQQRPELAELLDRFGGDEALVVDIVATGNSWYRFSEAMARKTDLFSVVQIDSQKHVLTRLDELGASRYLKLTSLMRTSELSHYSIAIEVLNIAPQGSTRMMARCGTGPVPVLADGHELPRHVVETLVAAHTAALDLVRKGRARLLEEFPADPPTELLKTLVQTMSVEPMLIDLGRKFT